MIKGLNDAKFSHCYRILKVKRNASAPEIREKYLRLSKLYHPDNQEFGSALKFIRLKESYELIKNAPLIRNADQEEDSTVGHFEQDLSHAAHIKQREMDGDLVRWSSGESQDLYRNNKP